MAYHIHTWSIPDRNRSPPGPDITAYGPARQGTTLDAVVPQLIITMQPTANFALQATFEIESIGRGDHATFRGKITSIRCLEQDWIVWYGKTALGRVVEISVPFQWSVLPSHRLLEYTVLYRVLPDVLRSEFPQPESISRSHNIRRV